ncbi:hypothetical protein Mapa_014059 [Marchantia paleacea]|nr:hypothetical protein Mapa_014059 [Marchantia paleacea]
MRSWLIILPEIMPLSCFRFSHAALTFYTVIFCQIIPRKSMPYLALYLVLPCFFRHCYISLDSLSCHALYGFCHVNAVSTSANG